MEDFDIESLRGAKRAMQEIYDICQRYILVSSEDPSIFQEISSKVDYTRSRLTSVLNNY